MNKKIIVVLAVLFPTLAYFCVAAFGQTIYGQGDIMDSFDEIMARYDHYEKSLYRHNITQGHSPYFIPANEIDAYSEDLLFYPNTFKNNNNITFTESEIGRIHDLQNICFAHENYERLPFEWEKKLENCDIFYEFYNEFLSPSEEILNDRDYRDKEK